MKKEATPEEAAELAELRAAFLKAKASEDRAVAKRKAIQDQVLAHPAIGAARQAAIEAGEKTSTVSDLWTVGETETRKWDQDGLTGIKDDIAPGFWPFKTEYKEVRAESKSIEEKFPDLWTILRRFLVVTPGNPSVAPKKETKKPVPQKATLHGK